MRQWARNPHSTGLLYGHHCYLSSFSAFPGSPTAYSCQEFRERLGSYSQLGMLGTVNFIGYLIGTLCLSPLISRFPNQKHVINRVSCFLLGLAMIGSAFSNQFMRLGLWRFFIGLLSAVATVLVLSIAMDAVRPAERGVASGLIWLGGSAGILVTGLFAP